MFGWLKSEPKPLVERRELLAGILSDYPLYEPPHRQGPNFLRRRPNQSEEEYFRLLRDFSTRGDENFRYFMEQRSVRLAALYAFLREFGVDASLDDFGLAAVSGWLPGNVSALVRNPTDKAVVQAFYQMQTPWTNGLRGYNVVFDLGIFLGECLIQRAPRLHWKKRFGTSDHGESAGTSYWIEGFKHKGKGAWLDPPQYISGACQNELNDICSRRPINVVRADLLVGVVRDFSNR